MSMYKGTFIYKNKSSALAHQRRIEAYGLRVKVEHAGGDWVVRVW